MFKHLTILLTVSVCIVKHGAAQPGHHAPVFGRYEGIEIRYLQAAGDTSSKADRMNERWGKKKLTLDSSGTFLLEFPVPYPTTRIGLTRSTKGKWSCKGDTLILNSYHPYSDFIRVKERRVDRDSLRIKLKKYTYGRARYYPSLEMIINNREPLMIDTKNRWTYLPPDMVKTIRLALYAGPTSTEREWLYTVVNRNSNSFAISVKDNIEGNNFVVEDYKLLIAGSSLLQIDRVFRLDENCFKLKDPRE